jgi:hypothetical protein
MATPRSCSRAKSEDGEAISRVPRLDGVLVTRLIYPLLRLGPPRLLSVTASTGDVSSLHEADPAVGLEVRPTHILDRGDPFETSLGADLLRVNRGRRRFASIKAPSSTRTIGSPLSIGGRRLNGN